MMDRLATRSRSTTPGSTLAMRVLMLFLAFFAIERAGESTALACFGALGCTCNPGHACSAGLSCVAGSCTAAPCVPTTCAALGATCGTPDNGCGVALSCGTCSVAGQTCGGGASANTCGACTPLVACPGGKVCGTYGDGCGGSLSCGTCGAGTTCNSSNTCGACVANSCGSLGKNCGSISDGCGGTLSCGACGGAVTCGGGGSPNVCGSGAIAPTAFGAGSLIIPMDNCYNPDYSANPGPTNSGAACVAASTSYACYSGSGYPTGNVRLPFGLLYLLATNNIPINIILNPAKTSLADPDMFITPPSGSSTQTASVLSYNAGTKTYSVNSGGMTCNLNTVYYPGMPFVVDAPYAAQALQVISTFSNSEFTTLPMHIANYPFTAPVLVAIASRPKPVLIDGAPLDTFFTESGIPDVVANTYLMVTGAGSAWSYQWPTSLGTIPTCGGASGGFQTCNSLTSTVSSVVSRIVDVLWNHNGDLNGWTGMGTFFQNSGTVFTLADATTWEGTYSLTQGGALGGNLSALGSGAQKGPFCAATPMGVASYYNSTGSSVDYPASDPFLQLGTMDLFMHGNGGGDGSSYRFNTVPALKSHALTNGSGENAIAGHPLVGGVQASGSLIYLGSLNSWHGGAAGKDGGLRIMYNTLLAFGNGTCGGAGCIGTELSRSTPVSGLYGEYFRGSFDWKIPANTLAGNALYVPAVGAYPYATGHLREYKAAAANVPAGGDTTVPFTGLNYNLTSACSASNPLSPCNWDAATLMKPYALRNVYVVTPSTTTLTAAATAGSPAGWAATNLTLGSKLTNGPSGVLGGIDYSTAAVIEAKPTGTVTIAGAATRPTIAYVGARDGMLHAFCVAPGSADVSGRCYGIYARGEEIWAIVPPGVQSAMIAANTSGDWSKVNVGGSVRVADLKDSFTGETSTGFRTVLIVGSRDLGYIDAFDVSNPNPANINTDGFRFLWENDGTKAVIGTPPAMKQSMGASIALVDSSTSKGVALVAASLTTAPGIVTYGMQVADGKVFAYDSRTYTKTIPLAAGASAPIPNDVPALPTIIDLNNDGNDETVFVTDFQGGVQKIGVTVSAFSSSAQVFDMSTTANGCTSTTVACQPIGASPSVVLLTGGSIGVVVVTGGSDAARAFPNSKYYVGGFKAGTGAALFAPLSLGALATLPAGPVPATGMPLRGYAALTVSGTALFADGTTLAANDLQQLVQPALYPGQYGDVRRWDSINATPGTSISQLPAANVYSGGYGSLVEINGTSGGSLVSLGTNQGLSIVLASSDSGLANAAYHVGMAGGIVGRNFTSKAWFDLAN